MKVTLILPDYLLPRMLQDKKRVKGSLGVLNEAEMEFNAYNIGAPLKKHIYKLPHGEASMRGKYAHLHLRIDTEHEKVDVGNAIFSESAEAQIFFDELAASEKQEQQDKDADPKEPADAEIHLS